MKKIDEIKKHLMTAYGEKEFACSTHQLKGIAQITNGTQFYIGKLKNEGFLELVKPAIKLYRGWAPAVYRITKQGLSEMTHEEKLVSKTKNIKSDAKKTTTEKTDLKAEEFFKDKAVRFIISENQSYIPVYDISKALDLSYGNLHHMISRNAESFSGQIKTLQSGSDRMLKCVNQEGLINLLLSISSSRLNAESRKNVVKFRKWSISKINQLIVVGSVILSPEEHTEVKNVISESIDASLEDLEKMFSDINEKFDIFSKEFSKAQTEIIEAGKKVSKIQESNKELRVKNEYLSGRNNFLINNVQQLEQKITDTFVRSR